MSLLSGLKGTFTLTRPINCLITGTSVGVGALTSGTTLLQAEVGLAALSASLIAAAGNSYNDLMDLEIDRLNRPHRPLPASRVSPENALALSAMLAAAGLGFALSLGIVTGIVAIAVVLLLVAYSRTLKSRGLAGNIAVSAAAAAAFPFGAAAAGAWGRSWIPTVFALLFHLGREVAKDVEDMAGDRVLGVSTLALTLGARSARLIAAGLLLVVVAGTAVPWLLNIYGWTYLSAVAVLDVFVIGVVVRMVALNDDTGDQRISKALTGAMGIGLLAIVLGEIGR